MNNLKLFASKYVNQNTIRLFYILLSLLALALAGGAPEDYGGGG